MPLFCHKKANVQSRNCCFPKIPLSSRQICCCASIQHESWVTHKHTQAPTLLVCAFNTVCRLCCMSWPSCAMSSHLAWHSLPGCRINTQLECPIIYFRPLHVSHRSFTLHFVSSRLSLCFSLYDDRSPFPWWSHSSVGLFPFVWDDSVDEDIRNN